MSYYSKLATAYTRTAGAHSGCCAAGSTDCTIDSKIVNKLATWSCFNHPNAVSPGVKYSFTSKSLELAACPFDDTYCGAKREFTFAAVAATESVTLTAMAAG